MYTRYSACRRPLGLRDDDLLPAIRTADGPRPGAPRAGLSTLERNEHYRNRHRILPGVRRGTLPVCGAELLPVLRPDSLARTLEPRKEELAWPGNQCRSEER